MDGIVGGGTWREFQNYPVWSRRQAYSDDLGMYYYEYKTVLDSAYNIRHYSNGKWYVKKSNGLWYSVN